MPGWAHSGLVWVRPDGPGSGLVSRRARMNQMSSLTRMRPDAGCPDVARAVGRMPRCPSDPDGARPALCPASPDARPWPGYPAGRMCPDAARHPGNPQTSRMPGCTSPGLVRAGVIGQGMAPGRPDVQGGPAMHVWRHFTNGCRINSRVNYLPKPVPGCPDARTGGSRDFCSLIGTTISKSLRLTDNTNQN